MSNAIIIHSLEHAEAALSVAVAMNVNVTLISPPGAAATMGADDRTILRTIILPLILPYIISGMAFAFVLSLNEYIVAYMAVGFTVETLPIKIFNSLRYGYTPTMASVTVLFVAIAVVVFGLIARFGDLPRLLGAWRHDDDS